MQKDIDMIDRIKIKKECIKEYKKGITLNELRDRYPGIPKSTMYYWFYPGGKNKANEKKMEKIKARLETKTMENKKPSAEKYFIENIPAVTKYFTVSIKVEETVLSEAIPRMLKIGTNLRVSDYD